jgi:Putative transposase
MKVGVSPSNSGTQALISVFDATFQRPRFYCLTHSRTSHSGVIAILHTFNGELKFNSHVHTMVTGGGLHGSSDIWVSRVYYDACPRPRMRRPRNQLSGKPERSTSR